MSIFTGVEDTNAIALISAVGAGVITIFKVISSKFSEHNVRITDLERESTSKEAYESSVSRVYFKMDEGFKRIHERIDKVFDYLADSSNKKD